MFKKGQSGNPAGKKPGTKNKAKFINVAERLKEIDESFCVVNYVLDIAIGNNEELDNKSCRMQAVKMLYDKATLTPKETDDGISVTPEQILEIVGKSNAN